MTLTADTRFQTTISPVKAALGALCLLALVGRAAAAGPGRPGGHRAGAAAAPALVASARRWTPPWGRCSAGWWLVGAVTVDDGYIAGIVRSRDSNGFIGNVYRWLNAPGGPVQLVLRALRRVVEGVGGRPAGCGCRRPCSGCCAGLLLRRLLLPRLGRFARRPAVGWLAALAFGTWWVPFNLGLRPEPWVAVACWPCSCAVERALATRRIAAAGASGLVLAGAGTAMTPAGVMAFAPLVAAAPRLFRLLRARRDLHALAAARGAARRAGGGGAADGLRPEPGRRWSRPSGCAS